MSNTGQFCFIIDNPPRHYNLTSLLSRWIDANYRNTLHNLDVISSNAGQARWVCGSCDCLRPQHVREFMLSLSLEDRKRIRAFVIDCMFGDDWEEIVILDPGVEAAS